MLRTTIKNFFFQNPSFREKNLQGNIFDQFLTTGKHYPCTKGCCVGKDRLEVMSFMVMCSISKIPPKRALFEHPISPMSFFEKNHRVDKLWTD